MATTFSTNYQIKLIGDGEEDTTWGASTNKNLQLIEQMAGGGSVVQVESPSGASTWTSESKTLTWITSDTADAGAANSEGRSRFVKFTDGGSLTGGPIIINIRGSADAEKPERVFFVKNDLTTQVLELNNGSGANYSVANGAYAVVYCSGGTGGAVENVLNDLQVGGLNFEEAATIKIKDNVADALDITEGTNSYITIDTLDASTGRRVIIGSETTDLEEFVINTDLVNLSVQPTELRLKNDEALALKITDSAQTYVNLDTQSASVATITVDETKVVSANTTVGLAAAEATIRSNGNGNLTLKTGNTNTGSITIVDDSNEDILLKNHGTGKVMVGSSGHIATITSNGAYDLKLETNDGANSGVIQMTEADNGNIIMTPHGTGSVAMTKVDIDGGAIDGTVIGAAATAAITGTVVTASTSLDGVIGTVTPAAITALAISGTTIAGTAITGSTSVASKVINAYESVDAATVTGISSATEAIVTASNTFTDGDSVLIASVSGMTQVNGNYYVVSDRSGSSFKLKDTSGSYIDSSGFTAYSSGGTATDTSGYVNFDSRIGVSGIGVRNNSGSIEASNGSSSWESFVFKTVLALNTAPSSTDGQDKSGAFDIGPIRVIYNTVLVDGGDTITLGDSGEGTSVSMDSALYTVMSSWADAADGVGSNYGIHVLDSSAGTMSVNGAASDRRLTYWAIGDSGK